MADLRTFSVVGLILIYGGVSIKGFADGTFCETSFDDDTSKFETGADGTLTRILNNKSSAIVTFTLSQTSPSNTVLSAFYIADKSGNVPLPLFIHDTQGQTILESSASVIIKLPDASFAIDPTQRIWNIKCGRLDGIIGGNN